MVIMEEMDTLEEWEDKHGNIEKHQKNTRRGVDKMETHMKKRFDDRLAHNRRKNGEKVITRAEAAAHNRENDIYLIVDGVVYDATSFIADHPGGKQIMMKHAGQDVSTIFNDLGHSLLARFMMADLYKGDLPPIEIVPEIDDDSEEEDNDNPDDAEEAERPERIGDAKGSETRPDEGMDGKGKELKEQSSATETSKEREDDDRPPPQVTRRVANRYRRSTQGSSSVPNTAQDAVSVRRNPGAPRLVTPTLKDNWRLLLHWPVFKQFGKLFLAQLWDQRQRILAIIIAVIVACIAAMIPMPVPVSPSALQDLSTQLPTVPAREPANSSLLQLD